MCRFDLESTVHIRISPQQTAVCLKCFATSPQFANSSYAVFDSLEKKLFCQDYELINAEDWSLREEALLLEGLQHCGFGNWTDIAKKVGTKSRDQCEAHYLKFWWACRSNIPELEKAVENSRGESFKDFDVQRFSQQIGKIVNNKADAKQEMNLIRIGLTKAKIDKFRSRLFPVIKPGRKPNIEKKDEKAPMVNTLAANKFVDVYGYYPLRRDFDIEHDCEAENYIADMEFEGKLISPRQRH